MLPMLFNTFESTFRSIHHHSRPLITQAAGFEERVLPSPTEEDPSAEEAHLVWASDSDAGALEALRLLGSDDAADGSVVGDRLLQPRLDRATAVFEPSDTPHAFPDLPDDFYVPTSAEVQRDVNARARERELASTFMTRDGRAAARGGGSSRRYRFCLLRVRFPDGIVVQVRGFGGQSVFVSLLSARPASHDPSEFHNPPPCKQGTFRVSEKVWAVRAWLAGVVADPTWTFDLTDVAMRQAATPLDDGATLTEADLVPASLLTLTWTDDPARSVSGIHPRLLESIQDLAMVAGA